MRLKINGKEREVSEGLNIPQLLSLLQIRHKYVAIELNKEIVKRSEWENTILKDGDVIEIVTFVGGGSIEK